jgi:hypothetical protein
MADYLSSAKEVRTISAAARSALEKLPAPAVVSVMEDMLRLASEGNNNNNNNSGGGGGGSVTATPVSREEMLQKLGAAVSDADLQSILKQQGIL